MDEFPPRVTICTGSVVLRNNKVLFVRQAYGKLNGKWSIPWGFAYTPGISGEADPPHIAALRETREEAGIEAEIDGLLGIQNHVDPETGSPRLYILFLCHHVSGEPAPDHYETDRAEYFSLEALKAAEGTVDEFCYWLAMKVLQGDYSIVLPNYENPYKPYLAFI
jgi:8-oxo-dGTP diphosphatase